MEVVKMAEALGVTVPVLRFLVCYFATVPISHLCSSVIPFKHRHSLSAYAAASGALLSVLAFGASSIVMLSVPIFIGYTCMLLFRPFCGILTFFLCFSFLIASHVHYMSGDAWKEGGIDATGALMVLTLKVISCAMNYNDGLLKEKDLRDVQRKNKLIEMPSLLDYLGYCLCCGSHFAGPVFVIRDYLDWADRKGIWAEKVPSPYWAAFRALLKAAFCMAMYMYLVPLFPVSRFSDPIYQKWGFFQRLGFQYMSAFTARWKYYFIWSVSEAAVILSKLGFSGWEGSSPRWDRAKNVDVIGVEFAKSSVELPLAWNIQVSSWLRYYVYERLILDGKKPGFFQLLGTQTASAVWHGLYPGYAIFFVHSALMIAGSRAIYRMQQALPPNKWLKRKILGFLSFAYTVLVLNYSSTSFLVLNLEDTLAIYGSVYYVGTIIPIALIALGYLKPSKKAIPKVQKVQ